MKVLDRIAGWLGYVPAERLVDATALISRQYQELDTLRKPWEHIVRVSDELVEEMRDEWSQPVQVKIATRKQGFYRDELELVFRKIDRMEYPAVIIATDYQRGAPCS